VDKHTTVANSIKYVGLDVHKETIAVAVADSGTAEPRVLGIIPNDCDALRSMMKTVELIDFDFATVSAEQHSGFAARREIVGTLAYAAPEQTGRNGRPIDHRTDLYALGVTLYELAIGRLPFEAVDPLELIHDHAARFRSMSSRLRTDLIAWLEAL
jgi:serine/threonine protein kinase